MRNITGAVRTIKQNNVLGLSCSILCPTAQLCEKECSATNIDRPIQIGKIQRFLMEYSRNIDFNIWEKLEKKDSCSVAIIGSGPAGLTCAAELAKNGHKVTVFESKHEAGGVLRYGVPEHRFPVEYLKKEIEPIKDLGVEFKCDSPIKGDNAAENLLKKGYDAVFIATGLWKPTRLNNKNISGVFTSTDFLSSMKENKSEQLKNHISGKKVAVIGGGSVAVDCVETSFNLGAKDVYLIYRRSFLQMPAEEDEKLHILNAGAHLLLLNQPVDYIEKNGKLHGVILRRTELGKEDNEGRRKPVEIPNSDWELKVDTIIEAIGSGAEDGSTKLYPSVSVDNENLIKVKPDSCETSVNGIFAGGDIVNGPSLIIKAVHDGKIAAAAINDYLNNESAIKIVNRKPCPELVEGSEIVNRKDLSIEFCGVKFKNPFLLSSSPVSNSAEMVGRAFDAGWAGVAYKTVVTDRLPIIHPSPRMKGYNYQDERLIGLQNVEQTSDRGLQANLKDMTYLKKHWPDHIVMSSIMGFSNQEWADLAIAVTDAGADMIELNFSCPHMTVEGSGAKVGQVQELVQKFTETVRKVTPLPLVAKLTPNITDMIVPALYAKKGGANAISAINTVRGLAGIDINKLVPDLNVFGKGSISGYSGPAVKPIGLRYIAELAKNKELNLPLSGMGGIETWIDALEYILLGASTIQATTGVIHYGYSIVEDMIEGLSDYMQSKNISRVSDLVGKALQNLCETDAFNLERQGIAKYELEKCIGCGQCYVVCHDAGGQALEWDSTNRRPVPLEEKCLSCMICSFVCPVHDMIKFKEMPQGWKRAETLTLG
jgi:dihydroorotate dehydrogenase subfamily 1